VTRTLRDSLPTDQAPVIQRRDRAILLLFDAVFIGFLDSQKKEFMEPNTVFSDDKVDYNWPGVAGFRFRTRTASSHLSKIFAEKNIQQEAVVSCCIWCV